MRAALLITLVAALGATSPAAAQSKSKKAPPASKTVTLTGCVAEDPSSKNLTIEDQSGSYRLSGMNIRDYLGHRVELAGSIYENKKLVIKGGLTPSPNAAAQAGAIDQTQVANETHGGAGTTGDVQLPEFRVKSIRPLGTGCK
jgi:hypothetical protein